MRKPRCICHCNLGIWRQCSPQCQAQRTRPYPSPTPAALTSTAWLRGAVAGQPAGPSETMQALMRSAGLTDGGCAAAHTCDGWCLLPSCPPTPASTLTARVLNDWPAFDCPCNRCLPRWSCRGGGAACGGCPVHGHCCVPRPHRPTGGPSGSAGAEHGGRPPGRGGDLQGREGSGFDNTALPLCPTPNNVRLCCSATIPPHSAQHTALNIQHRVAEFLPARPRRVSSCTGAPWRVWWPPRVPAQTPAPAPAPACWPRPPSTAVWPPARLSCWRPHIAW